MRASDEITSLDSFQKKIERYEIVYPGRLFFRGENSEYRERTPGILRDDGFPEHEADFYSELLSTHQRDFLQENDFIDRLALMQHYGAPTRLIDMSVNPYIALYFACEESKDEDPGYLYMYVPIPVSKTSEQVRLLSWMACNKWNDIEEVCKNYRILYAQPMPTKWAREFVKNPVFICQEGFTESDNERINAQKGTFVICGEQEIDGHWKIAGLDSVKPALTFRITPEYKKKIRDELNDYGINTSSIYKDLMSASQFLRSKYGQKENGLGKEDYEIIENERASTSYRKSKELQMIMKKRGPIESIHKALKEEILDRCKDVDVVWAYVSMSQKDYVSHNYRILMQWINPEWKFKDKFPPQPFKHIGDAGFSWQDNDAVSIMSDFDDEHLYSQPEGYIFVSAYTLFSKAKEVFEAYQKAWGDENGKESLERAVIEKASISDFINDEWDNVGSSVDKEVADFLNHFSNFFINLSSMAAVLNDPNYQHLVTFQLKNMQADIDEIERKKSWWRNKIGLTDEELKTFKPLSIRKERLHFEQTIPPVGVTLDVQVKVETKLSEDGRIIVIIQTNLFDKANLMVSVKDTDTGKQFGSAKSFVKDGIATFEPIGKVGSLHNGVHANVSVTLSVSSTQDIDFVKKAGIQYENLSGDFIDKNGIMPSGKIEEKVQL